MKSRALVVLSVLALLGACDKKDKTLPTNTNKVDYFPLTIGSYWVYNTYSIDSAGNEVLESENDTIKIIGDTVLLNGKTYKVFAGKQFKFSNSSKTRMSYRDSSGYIVNEFGDIKFCQSNFNDTFNEDFLPSDDIQVFRTYSLLDSYDSEIDLLCGVFDSVLNFKNNIDYLESDPLFIGSAEQLYAPNVGLLISQYFYANDYQSRGKYYEKRLIDYHIEP